MLKNDMKIQLPVSECQICIFRVHSNKHDLVISGFNFQHQRIKSARDRAQNVFRSFTGAVQQLLLATRRLTCVACAVKWYSPSMMANHLAEQRNCGEFSF